MNNKKTIKACTPSFGKYAMARDVRAFVASVFSGADLFTIKAESADKAFVGVKHGASYLTAFDFVYRVKRINLHSLAESEIAAGRLSRRHKARAVRAVEMTFGGFNYARAAFYAHVLGMFAFGEIGHISKGIVNLAAFGIVSWRETRKTELAAYHSYQTSSVYRAEYHNEKATMFRKNARLNVKYARLHEKLVAENGGVPAAE